MPQQDYVKTARPAPRAKTKKPAKKTIPVPLIAAVLILLAGFGYFLWHISHRPGAAEAAMEHQLATEKAKAAKAQVTTELPPKPVKEPYTYIQELKNKEIKVQAEELVQKAPATMYCGTFKALDEAQALKVKIAFEGVAAEIKENDGKYRVIVGPYASKRMAQTDKNKLLRNKVANCWIP